MGKRLITLSKSVLRTVWNLLPSATDVIVHTERSTLLDNVTYRHYPGFGLLPVFATCLPTVVGKGLEENSGRLWLSKTRDASTLVQYMVLLCTPWTIYGQ